MIQSLRKKLILINMSLVLVVLLAVFTGLCLYTAGNQQQNAQRRRARLRRNHQKDAHRRDGTQFSPAQFFAPQQYPCQQQSQ